MTHQTQLRVNTSRVGAFTGTYVRIRIAPGGKLEWALQKNERCFLTLTSEGNPLHDAGKQGDADVVQECWVFGTPVEVRPAGMNLHYGRLEEISQVPSEGDDV